MIFTMGTSLIEEIIPMYQDRAYHNIDHIHQCLRELDSVKDLIGNGVALGFALAFHDAVYNPELRNNEEESAIKAITYLEKKGAEKPFIKIVVDLILVTKHTIKPKTLDECIIVDIDLSILGQSEEIFDKYESAIREEYAYLSDEDFWIGRSEFLEDMLFRKKIFHTARFQNKYEMSARKNLNRSLRRI